MSAFARWIHLSVVIACALVLGLLSPVQPPARAEEAPEPEVTSAPALPSEESPVVEPEFPEGEFEEPELASNEPAEPAPHAPEVVPELGGPIDTAGMEVLSRSEFRTTYGDDSGSRVAEISIEPLNARVDGEWVGVDPSLTDAGDGWSLTRFPGHLS